MPENASANWPPPGVLEASERAVAGPTERDAQHRRGTEHMQVEPKARLALRSQAFGFTIALLFLADAGALFAAGETVLGITVLAGLDGLAGLVAWSRFRG